MTEHPVKECRGSDAAVALFDRLANNERPHRTEGKVLAWLVKYRLVGAHHTLFGTNHAPTLKYYIQWHRWKREQEVNK